MKLFSLHMVAQDGSNKATLFTKVCKDKDDAINQATEYSNKFFGDHLWRPGLHTEVDLEHVKEEVKEKMVPHDKNWILKLIIDNKDKKLFKSMDPYLTEPEKLLIKDKFKADANKS